MVVRADEGFKRNRRPKLLIFHARFLSIYSLLLVIKMHGYLEIFNFVILWRQAREKLYLPCSPPAEGISGPMNIVPWGV